MKELISIIDELHAPKNLKNSFGGFNYRDASGILEAVKPLLKQHECLLSVTSTMEQHGERYYIVSTATLRNKAGESVSASAPAREDESKKGMDAAQLSGACISYSKKYALCNLFCIDDSELDPDTDKATEIRQQNTKKDKPVVAADKEYVMKYYNISGWPEWLAHEANMAKDINEYRSEDWTIAANLIRNAVKQK